MLSKTEMYKVAMANQFNASKPGLTTDEVVHYYSNWAKDSQYDEQITDELYKGPRVVAVALSYHLLGRTDVSVLDVAAGSGKVAVQLKRLGINTIDGIDPAEGMFEAAKQKEIYRNYFKAFFNEKVECIKSSEYDVAVCSGGFMEGHIPCEGLKEMVRCVKQGGLVVFVMREVFLTTVPEYTKLEPYMTQLEKDGFWVLVDRSVFPRYIDEFNGVRYVFKVTKTETEAQ